MKPTDKILLYDDYCPLCTWYSGLFVRFGLLQPGNRVAFSRAELSILTAIDIEKAKEEIPLHDPATKQTLYGIDALLDILGQKIPFIRQAGNCRPVKWILKKLYKLISYNRKVIVARKCGPGTFDCSPAFSFLYRVIFLVIFMLFNSLMLFPLHTQVFTQLSFYHVTILQLQAGHIIFLLVNCSSALFLNRKMAIEYLGQINVLALVCILLLSILMFAVLVFPLSGWLILFFMAGITAFIVKEYFRRMKYVGILTRYKTIVMINIICLIGFLVYVFH